MTAGPGVLSHRGKTAFGEHHLDDALGDVAGDFRCALHRVARKASLLRGAGALPEAGSERLVEDRRPVVGLGAYAPLGDEVAQDELERNAAGGQVQPR